MKLSQVPHLALQLLEEQASSAERALELHILTAHQRRSLLFILLPTITLSAY